MKSKKSQEKESTVGPKRISVRSAKAKGRNLQKAIGKRISDLLEMPFGPDEDISSRPMGQSGTDIRLSPHALKKFPYSVECKNQEKWNVPGFIEQAKSNVKEGTDWILFVTKNRYPTIAIMDCEHFFELLQRIKNAEKNKNKKLSKP